MKINIQRICDLSIRAPERHHLTDAGYDLRSVYSDELYPDESKMFRTGFIWEIPSGHCGIVKSRSGLSIKHDIEVFHGVIDSGYRGELLVRLTNRGTRPYLVGENDRIAQLIVMQVLMDGINIVDKISGSDRGARGFGSTGIE